MKLTIDARLISSSGIGGYLQNIIRSSVADRYDLRLLYREADKAYFDDVEDVELVRYDAGLYSIKELLQTSGKTYHTDIFWSPHYNIPLVNHASKLKVVTIHDVFHLAFFHTLSLSQKIYATLMMRQALKSDLIFTVSEFSKKEILKHIKCDADKIKVVYNGVNFERFNTPPSEEETRKLVFAKYKITEPYILYVGNVKPHKNLKGALLGFKELVSSGGNAYTDFKFIIVGQREGFITCDKHLNELLSDPFYKKHVHFTGWIDNKHLPVLYQNASAFVFPSLYEGFGFPPLEAMAAGCPVASSNAACLPEVYGDAALYFDPASPAEIGEALDKIITDPMVRNRLIQAGLEQAKKYTWENAINRKLMLLEEFT